MTLQTLIDQNNATVAFLHQQDYQNAVVSSTAAMTILQEQFRITPEIDDDASDDGDECVLECLDECMLLSNENNNNTINETDCDPCQDDTVFVYNQGIVMIPSCTDDIPFGAMTSIIIFNSALANQLYAKQQQQQTTQDTTAFERCLLRSKRLYEFALRAYSGVDHNVLFQFAVVNNIAVIELVTGHVALSTEYFENLMSALMLLLDRGCASRRLMRHMRAFLRNLPLFQVLAASAA